MLTLSNQQTNQNPEVGQTARTDSVPSEPAAVLIPVLGSLQLNLNDHKFGLVINWISVGRARVAAHKTEPSQGNLPTVLNLLCCDPYVQFLM